jgi:hypothetical protein
MGGADPDPVGVNKGEQMSLGTFRRKPVRRRWVVGITTTALAIGVLLVIVSAGAVVSGSPSGFESNDGNMVLNNKDGSHTDWNCFVGSTGFQSGTPDSKCKVTSGATQVSADANGEISWVPGQKFDTECPALSVNNNPPKDEFTNVASYNETAPNLDVYFYGATIRPNINGNASGDVELNQSSGNGTTSAGCRTSGDRLIAYDFLNGGTSLSFHVLTWITSLSDTSGGNNQNGVSGCLVAKAPPCWGAKVIIPDSSLFDGESNQSAILAADNGINGAALGVNAFAEFGINLSAALGLSGKCITFPQEVWESRSSGASFTSNPQDIEIESHTIQNCGSITIIKHTFKGTTRGVDQAFSYNQDVSGSATFSLNDSAGTDNSSNTKTFSNVLAGTYHISEVGPLAAGFTFTSVSCTATGGSSAADGTSDSTHLGAKTLTLTGGGSITCTYVNNQSLGAIKILKTSSKAAATPLAGAKFAIKDPSGNALSGSPFTTDANGVVCVDGLTTLGNYKVQETSPPTGYSIDDSTEATVNVTGSNAKCTDASFGGQTLTYTDTPLTDLTVEAKSQVSGGTQSTITCVDANNGGVGTGGSKAEDSKLTATGLKPGIYTCTVDIDP